MDFRTSALALCLAALPLVGAAEPAPAHEARALIEGRSPLLFGRLVHNVDGQSEATGGHFELYVHAATVAPAYEIRFRLAEAGEAAALREAIARHRAQRRRGSFFVLLAYEPGALKPAADAMAELHGLRAADILHLPGGTEELQALLDTHPALKARLPRHPGMQESWDWD